MKILVLGGSSFLGSHLIPRLLSHHHEVSCWVRKKSLANSIYSLFPDIRTFEDICKVGEQDMILNLIVDYGINSSEKEIFSTNVDLPMSLIRQTTAPRILNFSTALPENYSAYSKSKSLLEKELDTTLAGREIKHLKFQNFYGMNASQHNFIVHLINSMSQNAPQLALTNCMQKRDFIHVSDAAAGALAVIEGWENVSGRLIDIGTGEAVTLKIIVEFIQNELGSLTELQFGARKNNPFELNEMRADTTILKSLGWDLKYHWKDGIRKTISDMIS